MSFSSRGRFCGLCSSFIVLLLLPYEVFSQDLPATEIRIEQGKIDVTMKKSGSPPIPLTASVRISFQIHNPTDKPDDAPRTFPVVSPQTYLLDTTLRCQLLVDGKKVAVQKKPIGLWQHIPPDQKKERIDRWIREDSKLLAMVTKYRELASVRKELNELSENFETEVRKHLIHADDLHYPALYVARGTGDLYALIKLMPEIDPKLRIDGPHHRWKYRSLLNESDREKYRPYEKEWREKAEKWFASKPGLAKNIPRLRETYNSIRESQKLLAGPILKHLHDVNKLSLPSALLLKEHIQSPTGLRSTGLLIPEFMCTLFPDVRKKMQLHARQTQKQLSRWGFGGFSENPFIEKWRADRFLALETAGNIEANIQADSLPTRLPRGFLTHRWGAPTFPWGNPTLVTFQAPLPPKSSKTVGYYSATLIIGGKMGDLSNADWIPSRIFRSFLRSVET